MKMPACTFFNEQNKGPNLLSISTWSVFGKQNVQAKKVYYRKQHLAQKFGFIKWVDKGWLTTVKGLESWRFWALAFRQSKRLKANANAFMVLIQPLSTCFINQILCFTLPLTHCTTVSLQTRKTFGPVLFSFLFRLHQQYLQHTTVQFLVSTLDKWLHVLRNSFY